MLFCRPIDSESVCFPAPNPRKANLNSCACAIVIFRGVPPNVPRIQNLTSDLHLVMLVFARGALVARLPDPPHGAPCAAYTKDLLDIPPRRRLPFERISVFDDRSEFESSDTLRPGFIGLLRRNHGSALGRPCGVTLGVNA